MSERLNKTSICSVVFLDIVNQSKKPVAEQIKNKDIFNGFINEAIKDVAQNDRILLDTGDGAAIALLGEPEEALFVAMTIRDSILRYNNDNDPKLFVRTGINLGPVRVVSDINGRPNILGDGINVAERVMSFSEPNQILVSRSYYEITSRLTEEITGMFSYFGIKQDKHIREHEVYLIRSSEDGAAVPAAEANPAAKQGQQTARFGALLNNENLSRYMLWAGGALVFVAVSISGFMLAGNLFSPSLGEVVAESEPVPTLTANAAPEAKPSDAGKQAALLPVKESKSAVTESGNNAAKQTAVQQAAVDKDTAAAEPTKRKTKASRKKETEPAPAPAQEEVHTVASNTPAHHDSAPRETQEPKSAQGEKSGWASFKESLKQGREQRVCTQAEIALNQCK